MACLHFNENVQRETEIGKDGKPYYRVSYPKFKLGEEVVREVAVPPSYGKCYVVNNKVKSTDQAMATKHHNHLTV